MKVMIQRRLGSCLSGLILLGTILMMPLALGVALAPLHLVRSEFPSDAGTTAFNYSPSLAQTAGGLILVWVGGSGVDSPDASVYLTRLGGDTWSQPTKVASVVHPRTLVQTPCQRPVLFKPTNGPLLLFYKTVKARHQTVSYVTTSRDNGITWFKPKTLPRSIFGPARTKPIELPTGVLLCGSDTHKAGWRFHIERATAFRDTLSWTRTRDLSLAMLHNASEPVLLDYGGGNIQALCRTKRGYVVETWSDNHGETWSAVERTMLPNPDSGLDAIRLDEQQHAVVYQHSNRERGVLNLAVTEDGKQWAAAAVLEHQPDSHFSDPSIVLGADGNLHLVYSVNHQRVKYIVTDPDQLSPVSMVGGNWPY
ncbi:MAG: hypothetical protein M2R45_01442 [Verrucomicrobia subdivision 3 bacterium]|nr:hypothetical protein [Limisphaerales bacterium]MCS1417613.1 hypothetical protein [Limisphaerales bacterium]